MSLITIDQLLESVDLGFEPRFVTKDEIGVVELWEKKPNKTNYGFWSCYGWQTRLAVLKLAEFDGKDWTECIYEVPRKTDEYEQNLEKLRPADSDLVYRVKLPRKTTGNIEKLDVGYKDSLKIKDWQDIARAVENKINELVDAVNELMGDKHPISNPQAKGAKND